MDEQLFFLINSHHTEYLDAFMWMVSQKTVWLPLYACLLYVVWRQHSWRGALYVLLAIGIGMLFTDWGNSHLLRPWIGRLRPSNPDNPIAPMVHIVYGRHGSGCGMPSAHSANMWLLTFVVCHWLRSRWTCVSMTLLTLLVCYSRVYLGYHYPGDILGGFVLALCVVWMLSRIFSHSLWRVGEPRVISPLVQYVNDYLPMLVVVLTLLSFALSSSYLPSTSSYLPSTSSLNI